VSLAATCADPPQDTLTVDGAPGVTVVLTAALGLPQFSEAGEIQMARVPPAPAHRHEYWLPIAAEVDLVRAIPKCEDLKAPEPPVPRATAAVVIFRMHRSLGCDCVGSVRNR
jgi:hypothetical protein